MTPHGQLDAPTPDDPLGWVDDNDLFDTPCGWVLTMPHSIDGHRLFFESPLDY